jgi:hypothetical protein
MEWLTKLVLRPYSRQAGLAHWTRAILTTNVLVLGQLNLSFYASATLTAAESTCVRV